MNVRLRSCSSGIGKTTRRCGPNVGKTMEGTHCVRLVCVIHVVFLCVACSCPDGLIERMDGSCCKPVQCEINQGFKPCSMFDSADSCYDCPSGTINRDPFNTADYSVFFMNEICVKIDCDCLPEAELQNSEECKINGKKDCVCKRWDLYYGEDPALCLGPLNDSRMLRLLQQPGYELKIDGKVAECDKGYYKSSSDYSICRPHSKCPNGSLTTFNGSTTQDITCQRVTTAIPLTTTTTSLTTTTSSLVNMAMESVYTTQSRAYQSTFNTSEKIKFAIKDVKKHETHNIGENITPTEQPGSSAERQKKGNDVLIISLVCAGSLVLMILLVICFCYCRSRNKKRKARFSKQDINMVEIKRSHPNNCDSGEPVSSSSTEDENPLEEKTRLMVQNEVGQDFTNGGGKKDNCGGKTDPQEESVTYLKGDNCCEESGLLTKSEQESYTQNDNQRVNDLHSNYTEENQEDGFQSRNQILSAPLNNSSSSQCDSKLSNDIELLQSDGLYSILSMKSLIDDSLCRVTRAALSASDSDYSTDSSQINETRNSDLSTLNSDITFQSLHPSSVMSSTEVHPNTALVRPYKENRQSKEKIVAVVRPYFKDGQKIEEDGDQTHSKTP